MNTALYAIALQSALGIASPRLVPLFKTFASVEAIFSASEEELKRCGYLSESQVKNILNPSLEKSRNILIACKNLGIEIIPFGSKKYPARLAAISDPPCVLYVLGDFPDMDNEVAVAMVGTRHATKYGYQLARKISFDLSAAGAVIVSGGAIGIDTACHTGALEAGGKTVAVLGCGIFANYLMRNEDLRMSISKNGALVSEFPPRTPVQKFSFPVRNRILSGLSLGTAVIEAGEKSGALSTASHAAEQGRDVFVLPGNILEPTFQGSNRLLRDGAKPLFSAVDILEEYASMFEGKLDFSKLIPDENAVKSPAAAAGSRAAIPSRQTDNTKARTPEREKNFLPSPPKGLSEDGLLVYNSFKNSRMTLDELIVCCGLSTRKVLCALTELELFGTVRSASGGVYEIIGKNDTSF